MTGQNNKYHYSVWYRLLLVGVILALVFGSQTSFLTTNAQALSAPIPALATTNTITLQVVSARTEPRAFGGSGVTIGDEVPNYKYIINIDNAGTTEQRSPADGCSPSSPGYPDSCHWVSVAGVNNGSFSPIYTQGDQSDFASGINLPDGKYLISVIADGYKLDGTHFSIPMEDPGLVRVELQPTPLPDATIRSRIFEDNAPTNSAPDEPAEHGLAGFTGHIIDYIGEVTTDVYGNPLCTTYVGEDPVSHMIPASALDADMLPVVAVPGGHCVSDVNGDLVIPHLGTNRYALSAVPPSGSNWIQTTTLEGNHDWDAWVMEGSTGFDTEFVVAGEPFPATFFGFVHASNTMSAGTGEIKGLAMAVKAYIPPVGGITGETGLLGAKAAHPIDGPWVSLADLNNGDQTVFVGKGNSDGTFDIQNVPNGDYVLGIWDEPQDYIFNLQNVSVKNGELTEMGAISMMGWWTTIEGYVFSDTNGNGKMDAGEHGIPNFPIAVKKRENSVMDRGTVGVVTDQTGHYFMESAYPITQWLVAEAYSDLYQTTGVTFQADNQPTETTVLGSGVDVNFLPIIGLGGRLDWGVKAYNTGTNGGIVGTVTYDTTRNELDPRFAFTEDWQPGIPGLTVDLYAPVDCPLDVNGDPTAPCDPNQQYQLDTNGSILKGQLLNQITTETWERPTGCVARNVNGDPLAHGVDENVLPLDPNAPCLEGPLMGVQFGPMSDGTNFGASVDGNYGFGDGCFGPGGFDPNTQQCADGSQPTSLTPADYLVKVEIPTDVLGHPAYQVTREEDINIFHGDQFIPQIPPPACAGALHTVDVAGVGTDGYSQDTITFPGVTVPASSPNVNTDFAGGGGSPFEGRVTPLCDTKLIRVSNGRSIAPNFNLFTDVPLPSRFWGLIVDDLNFSSDSKSLGYGEKMGIAFAPVGIYDFANRLVDTVESDYNGLFDVLLPSTNRISCPTPSGVCANLYRFVGNDPGVPGRWNANYNPQFRTIAAEFEGLPGLLVPADLAPTQVGVGIQIPGTQTLASVSCKLDSATPQFFAINQPYMNLSANGAARTFTVYGLSFGTSPGSVTLDGTNMNVNIWNDRQVVFSVPSLVSSFAGPHQLKITAANGKSTINSLTFHLVGGTYNPAIKEVGGGKPFATIQSALNSAASSAQALVVVYPGAVDANNPRYNGRGSYYENLIMYSPAKLQGIGPGGVYPDNTPPIQGSIIDGIAFGGDTALADAWRTQIASLTWDGNQDVYEGQVIYVVAHDGQFGSAFKAAIDGFDIRGGDLMGFAGNVNAIFGGYPGPGTAGNVETQGGAIFANAYARYLQITNNTVQNNSGAYGTIRIGTPNISDQQNDNVRIANNRIFANGGTNLAGAIGLYNGADNYEIASNDICGNFSAEYGGGISAFGLQQNQAAAVTNSIHDNRIYFNRSYDEGAGIMIAGELPVDPSANYGTPNGVHGSGPVNIYNNLIQANLSDDDGGGIRFLMAGNFPMNVYNNMIVNNVSTHEGAGIAIDDAPDVRFYNNTVMKNITTATAITSDGQPAPAGLSTGQNSQQLQNTLPGGSALFSNPLLFNNIFWDNRAGARGTNMVTGIGAVGDASPINNWDMGVFGGSNLLSPTNTILQIGNGITASPTNLFADPTVLLPYDVGLTFTSWRTNVNFTGAIMVSADLPPNLLGNYHIPSTSPAKDAAASTKSSISAPGYDIDNESRPAFAGFDIGADEVPNTADLSITKTDGKTLTARGATNTYTIVASNAGPNPVSGATVTDTFQSPLSVAGNWTCVASVGSSCNGATGSGNINRAVNLTVGGSVTFTVNATVSNSALSPVSNTAAVSVPAGITDPNPVNNTAIDTDTIPTANLAITKNTDNQTTVVPGGAVTYLINVSNQGPDAVSGATVTDNMPLSLTVLTWTCSASAGSSCSTGGTGNNRTGMVNLLSGGTARFIARTTLSATASGLLTNTATIAAPAGIFDPVLNNNQATDLTIIRPASHIGDLDQNSTNSNATTWQAFVTVTVHNAAHAPMRNIIVTGNWSAGSSGSSTCITNASGVCTLTRNLSRTANASVIFTVNNANLPFNLGVYQSGQNHDPDSGTQASNGTTISVPRP